MTAHATHPLPDVPRCCRCRWWRAREASEGDCRAHAPTLADAVEGERRSLRERTHWPVTLAGDGCGDFRPARE